MNDLAYEPMILMRDQETVHREHRVLLTQRLYRDRSNQRLRETQAQQRGVQFAERAQRPEAVAGRHDFGSR